MKHATTLTALSLLLCAAGAQAQLYKWVGPDGKVNYTDTPPPPSAKQVETKSLSTGEVSTSDLPFELAGAVRSSPVTLYTGKNCIPCEDGRKMLSERGIPYKEKTVSSNEDIEHLRKIAGDSNVPVLLVGRRKESGFQRSAWNTTLSTAGYPEENRLPKTWRAPPAEPAVPPPQQARKQDDAPRTDAASKQVQPAAGNAPPGFRF
jgi:glutaredoxin